MSHDPTLAHAVHGQPDDVVAMVPRINIHVFCDDRRPSRPCRRPPPTGAWRAPISIPDRRRHGRRPGLCQTHTPNVLIVEIEGRREPMLAELDAARQGLRRRRPRSSSSAMSTTSSSIAS